MDSIKNKIAVDYWVEKLKPLGSIRLDWIERSAAKAFTFGQDDATYFSKLTGGKEIAEKTIFLSVFSALIQRYFDNSAWIVSNNGPAVYDLDITNTNSLKDYIEVAKKEVQAVYKHINFDFDMVEKALGKDSFLNCTPFAINYGENELDFGLQNNAFILNITKIKDQEFVFSIDFSSDFVEEEVANHFLQNFYAWMKGLAHYIDTAVTQIPIISEEEKQQILHFNPLKDGDIKNDTIVSLFEDQAKKTPKKKAILFGETSLTYAQLNKQANQLAKYLRSQHNIITDDLIGIKLERNERLLVVILGVLKSGAAYVPIDVNYPEDRKAYIEKDSNTRLVIDEQELYRFKKVQGDFSGTRLDISIEPSDLAYVIYTSGSTGNPKGVMINHSNAASLINWASTEFDSSSFNMVYAATSHCFDLSIFEMFYTLAIGKTIRLFNTSFDISSYIRKDAKVLLNTVPSVLRRLIDSGTEILNNVTNINLAGEVFPIDLAAQLPLNTIAVRNLYGPSEDTTYSTSFRVKALNGTAISIGKAISNTQAYILDENLEVLPVGITGRLFLSGDGIASGYLNQPQLSKEKFVDNPFSDGVQMYDTGDLAQWLADGNISFMGRMDDQVKLRGYRIELGEIEYKITQYSDEIQEAVVAVKEVVNEPTLIGYIVSDYDIDISLLRGYLATQLPSYMIPSYFIEIPAIPVNANGKTDRNVLPTATGENTVRSIYVAPKNNTEEKLAAIWEELLKVEQVGVTDNFFELGGHSLIVNQAINKMYKELNCGVSYQDFFDAPTIEAIADKLTKTEAYLPIPKAAEQLNYPATDAQKRLWLLSQMDGGTQAYQIAGALELSGNVNIENFESAFRRVVSRHEILRTYFQQTPQEDLVQYIIPVTDFNYEIESLDLSGYVDSDVRFQEYVKDQQENAIRLSQAPLFRASIIKVDTNKYIFFILLHHIIGDGWSLENLTSEVVENYRMIEAGEISLVEPLTVQFKDYAVWLKDQLDASAIAKDKAYWMDTFSGPVVPLQLPSFKSRPLVKTYNGNKIRFTYSETTLNKLKEFSKLNQVTLFMTLFSGVKSLLARYSNQSDITIGTPIAGRSHPDLEEQIGLYLNTLAVRSEIDANDSFLTVLQQEKQLLLGAYAHQNFPFDSLVEELNMERDTSRSALFDIIVALQSHQQLSKFQHQREVNDMVIANYDLPRATAQFDIAFTFVEEGCLFLDIEYNTDIYEADFMETMYLHLGNLFTTVLKNVETRIGDIDFISPNENILLLEEFNDTDAPHNKDLTILDLFSKRVAETPSNIAVVYEGTEITYQILEEQSNKLAHYILQNYEISNEDLIAVQLERSDWLIIAMLAILKTGAAYVPIDVDYPESRIEFIIDDTKTKLVLNDHLLSAFSKVDGLPNRPPMKEITGANLAYVIYTSGSTGKPKGVMVEHSSLVNLCEWHIRNYNVTEQSRGTLFAGIAFDACVWEIYPYLVAGATLYPINKNEIRLDIERLSSFLRTEQITHAYLPSKICQDMVEKGISNLDTVILTGGEALKYSKATDLQIYNNYGPTENTVVTTYFNCSDHTDENIPIGKPIDNTRVYVVSKNMKLQPIGVIGELCISGSGLSRGYLNQPELTDISFVPSPFIEGERLYKTGDLVRWLPDGNIEFEGRKDNQIKIRGNRIELGEIEYAVLSYSSNIHQAVALLVDINNEKDIAIYYVASTTIDEKPLRDYLKSQLPVYMVPGYFLELEAIPLTVNGKVDIVKLPNVTENDRVRSAYVAPSNQVEEKLVVIWSEILEKDIISVSDDFFELGGHSLLLIKLTNEYFREFNVDLDLQAIYANTTLLDHSKLILESSPSDFINIDPIVEGEFYEVSPSQMRFWLLNKIYGKSKEFNIYSTLELPENLNLRAFEYAFNKLIKRHEILRTVFVEKNGNPKQEVLPNQTIEIPLVNVADTSHVKNQVFSCEFDLEVFPLFKIALVKSEAKFMLFFNIHHILCDGFSIGIIQKELMEIYNAKCSDRLPKLPILDVHYKDYAHWQNELLVSGKISKQQEYWMNQFTGEYPYVQLPIDYVNKAKSITSSSAFYTVFLNEELKNKIITLSVDMKVSVFAIFVAGLKILLHRLTGEQDIILGIPAANRNHYQLKNMVGCFLNTLMLRDHVNPAMSFSQFLLNVQKTLTGALANQSYPFESMLSDLNVPNDHSRFPLSSVFLNMLDFASNSVERIESFDIITGNLESSPKFDFECYLKSFENGFSMNCVYDNGLFKEETIALWMNEYTSIINQVVSNISTPIYEIELLETFVLEEEYPKPTNDFNFFEDAEVENTIVQRFETQAANYPLRVAVRSEENELTYADLNNRANDLAVKISEVVGNETQRIALVLNHDETSVIGMLGTLKAGHTYVPIDYANPLTRLKYIVEDAACQVIVCTAATQSKVIELQKELPNLKIVVLPVEGPLEDIPNLENDIDPFQEAYVLYTSGSTGQPKGVRQNHRNVLHFIRVYTNNINISTEDNLSVFSTFTFDASVKDIYGAILNGATVSFYSIVEKGLAGLADWMNTQSITIIHMVPTIYRHFMNQLSMNEVIETVRIIDMGGEACVKTDVDQFKNHFNSDALFINDYGPTESTIVSQRILSHDSELTRHAVPLGKPVLNTEVFLLTKDNKKAKMYEEGEIVFKSDYLSLGYLNLEELTNKMFTIDPIEKNGRVYRSGDIGRMLPNGEIEFVQRKDSQIKLNGMRIELSEIEFQLEKLEMVEEAIVMLKMVNNNNHLVAYVRTEYEVDSNTIKQSLKSNLPKHMVPTIFVPVDIFPLTRTGKIDRKKLPTPSLSQLNMEDFIAPENEIEKQLVGVWAEVLKLDDYEIGVKDNFFELGGNSLQAVLLINKLNKEFDTVLSIENLYDTQTIRDLGYLLQFSITQNKEEELVGADRDEILL